MFSGRGNRGQGQGQGQVRGGGIGSSRWNRKPGYSSSANTSSSSGLNRLALNNAQARVSQQNQARRPNQSPASSQRSDQSPAYDQRRVSQASSAPSNPFSDRNRYSTASSQAMSNPFLDTNRYSSGSSQFDQSRGRSPGLDRYRENTAGIFSRDTSATSLQQEQLGQMNRRRDASNSDPEYDTYRDSVRNIPQNDRKMMEALASGPYVPPTQEGNRRRMPGIFRRRR